jgi:hypothetical protein
MLKITKILLAGVAALLMVTSAVHAADKLPDTMMGTWCNMAEGDNEHQIYSRTFSNGHTCEMAIDQEAIYEEYSKCIFEKVQQISVNSFLVYTRCVELPNDDAAPAGGLAMYEIIDGKLIITPLSEG